MKTKEKPLEIKRFTFDLPQAMYTDIQAEARNLSTSVAALIRLRLKNKLKEAPEVRGSANDSKN